MGRVKIKFPWVETEGDSHWARISTLMAGKDRGTFFLPEPEDEVLVAFDKGDIRHPYVLGAIWNGQDNPPETNPDGKNNIRKIKSRSGHEIIFNDDHTAKQEKVEIHTKGGHKIVLDDSTGSQKIEIQDHTGSNKIIIDSNQNSISIESGIQLKLKSTKIDIEASAAMTIKAGGTLTIQGTLVKIN
jgi:uncharacterized protein involved in type VI secretion and phage assembly